MTQGTVPPPGDVWPKPNTITTTNKQYTIDKSSFKFISNLSNCDILQKAFDRYWNIMFIDSRYKPAPGLDVIEQLNVTIADSNAKCGYPSPSEDESYRVDILTPGTTNQAGIQAQTVWGALRGLETFSQLVYADDYIHQMYVNASTIQDSPRFRYRGVLLDTARHYVPKWQLLLNLDAMAYNKFNTFQWHLVDDQSFPFVSETYPTLHQKGAFTPAHIYTPEDVQEVIEYARLRGIRVIPELDSPGHTHGMAQAFPELLTPCWKDNKPNQPNYPLHSETELLNPMKEFTFEFMKKLFVEFKNTFKDEYIHLGMDEVFYACWESNPNITVRASFETFTNSNSPSHI